MPEEIKNTESTPVADATNETKADNLEGINVKYNPHTEETILDDTGEEEIKQPENQDEAKDNQQGHTRNELLAGKYKTEEELQKGLLELLKKQTGAEDLAEVYKKIESGDLGQPKDTKGDTKTTTDNQNVSFEAVLDEYTAEYLEKGELSEESMKALKKQVGKDVPDELIKMALDGRKAQYETYTNQLFELAGGSEEYNKILSWSKQNLPKEEQEAFDEAILSMNVHLVKLALDGVKARMETQAPNALLTNTAGELGNSSAADVYNSIEEVFKDMEKEEYYTNPQFAAKVRAKIARSNLNLSSMF